MYLLWVGMIELLTVNGREFEKIQKVETQTWNLAMNLNPADGHVMGYATGWAEDIFVGTYTEALTKDYLNRVVWNHPVSYIALVRHQAGEVDAVKVFRFKESARSLLSRFQDMDPGREIVTEGGPLQESISRNAQNMEDDPIFSVGGDLAFNWGYTDNGHRIVLTGGYLSSREVNDDNTHGLGNDFHCNPLTGVSLNDHWNHEISNIQDCPNTRWNTCKVQLQGTDSGKRKDFLKSGPVYGNYAIYVSEEATSFPSPGSILDLELEVERKLKFFQ
ncbi:hypothetical protein ACHWQZ_G014094 [Mnemiopsis leidyi]